MKAQNEKTNLLEIITLARSEMEKNAKELFFGDEIPEKVLNAHKKHYAKIPSSERVLLIVNKKPALSFGGYGWTGLIITDSNIYYKTINDSFFSSIVALGKVGKIALNDIKCIEVGDHDRCYGTAYIGHQLRINNQVVGLLRMGNAIEFNDNIITFLTRVFSSI